jgi:hypothetical protein
MSNEKQTAVDLFHDKVNELIIGKKTITSNDLGKIWIECKEMEKEQKILNYYQGADDESVNHGAGYISMKDAEEWYDKTYGGNK